MIVFNILSILAGGDDTEHEVSSVSFLHVSSFCLYISDFLSSLLFLIIMPPCLSIYFLHEAELNF